MNAPIQIAYPTRVVYPSTAAHALQILHMTAAFARAGADTTLIARAFKTSQVDLFTRYGVESASLRLWSLHAERWRSRFLRARPYNTVIAVLLACHPCWRARGQRQVVFMRGQTDYVFWGRLRRSPLLRRWLFVYEAHDLQYETPAEAERLRAAIGAYDQVIAITHGLAEDIAALTDGQVQPQVVPLSTGLARLAHEPVISFDPAQITLGYIGTIDPAHGLDDAFAALLRLPSMYRLRVVGHVKDADRAWLDSWAVLLGARLEICSSVGYADVASVIDSCDVVLAPAGGTLHSERYRSPLKLFDYMARGKPIIAGRVSAHEELLRGDVDTLFYTPGDPEHFAAQIQALTTQPTLAQALAQAAWRRSVDHTYDARAKHILRLLAERG